MAWNRPTEAAKVAPKKKPSALRGIAAGLAVVAVATIAAVYFLTSNDKKDPETKKATKARITKKIADSVTQGATNKVSAAKPAPVADDGLKPGQFREGDRIFTPISCTTNHSGYIDTLYVDQNGKRRHWLKEKPSIWASEPDRLLAVAISQHGGEIPPLPPMSREASDKLFNDSLANPTEVKPGDSEEVIALKKSVYNVKMQLLDRMANGEHFIDILEENRQELNGSWSVRREAYKTLAELKRSGSAEEVEKFVTEVNAKLTKFGIEPICVKKERNQ